MSLIDSWEEYSNRRMAKEAKEARSKKARREKRATEKQSRRHRKGFRLLARMAPELGSIRLELAKKKQHSSPWSDDIDRSPKGGIYFMGYPKANRQHDTRRTRANDSGIRGLRTVWIEDDPLLEVRERRSMIGNRNGSEKVMKDGSCPNWMRQLPRNERRQIALRELQEELAAMKELEISRLQEEANQQLIEDEEFARDEEWWRNWLTESERRERKRELDMLSEDPPWMDDDPPWSEYPAGAYCFA